MTPPKATSVDPISLLIQSWIRWLPAAIGLLGLAFVTWTVVMVMFVGRYHDAVGRMDSRIRVLEEKLIKAQEGREVEYWARQCESGWMSK